MMKMEAKKIFDLDASIEKEAAKKVKKVVLKPIPEIGVKKSLVLLSTVLEKDVGVDIIEEQVMKIDLETKQVQTASKLIEVVPPAVKTGDKNNLDTIKTQPVKLSKKQKRLREKYKEEVLNPLLPKSVEVVIYTDGSLVNSNKYTEEKIDSGGDAAIIIFCTMGNTEIMISGHKARPSSSHYMELLAVHKALKRLKKYRVRGKIILYSDDLPMVNDFNTKLAGWKECGWKKENGKYIRHWKLWKKVWNNSKKINLRVCWVKGHAENEFNNRCDVVARMEARLRAL